MRRLKLTGFAVIAILALAAMAMAGTATALEVLPTPSAEKPVKFKDKGGKGQLTVLEKTAVVKCAKNTSKGEFTTPTLGKDTIVFEGCEASGVKCTGLGDVTAGNITVETEVHFTDGLLSKTQVPAFAILVSKDVHFTCVLVLVVVLAKEGCAAGLVLENSLNKLVEKVFVSFLLEKGVEGDTDIPFINLPTESKCELKVDTNEAVGEDMGAITQEEEEIEGCEQGGKACTFLLHT